MSTQSEPLTPEEEAQMAQLQRRHKLAAWEQREAERVARQAALAPLVDLFSHHDLGSLAASLDEVAPQLDYELRQKVELVAQVARINLSQIEMRIAAAANPEPRP